MISNRQTWHGLLFGIRLVLGFLFLLSGLAKVRQPYDFLADVYAYQLTGAVASRWITIVLPWAETVIGLCLLGGFLLGGSMLVVAMLAVVFAYAQGAAIAKGLSITCGCFGSVWATDSINYTSMMRSAAILAAGVAGLVAWRKDVLGRSGVQCALAWMIGLVCFTAGAQSVDRPATLPMPPTELKAAVAPGVGEWLTQWQGRQVKGVGANSEEIAGLMKLLDASKSPAMAWARCAGLITFMDGDTIAKPLCVGAVAKAAAELAAVTPGAESAGTLVESLWPVHEVLWRAEDYAADERLVALLLPWERRGSGHSQWAHFVHAELLLYTDRYDDAYRAFQDCLAERKVAIEPSLGINRELDWELAICAFNAGHYAQALDHYERTAGQKGNGYAQDASACVCVTLAALGREDEAFTRLKAHVAKYALSPAAETELSGRIKNESRRANASGREAGVR